MLENGSQSCSQLLYGCTGEQGVDGKVTEESKPVGYYCVGHVKARIVFESCNCNDTPGLSEDLARREAQMGS